MMNSSEISILKKELAKEKAARKLAELNLERKSIEINSLKNELKKVSTNFGSLLNEKNVRLQGVFDTILDAYMVMNLKGHVTKMNDAAKDLFGYNIDIERLSVMDLIYADDERNAFDTFFELSNRGFFHDYTTRVVTKEKEIKLVQVNASIVFDVDNNPVGAQGIVRDITQDREDANLLLESKNRLSSLIENLDNGVLLEDENRKVVLTNNKYCQLFKIPLTPKELIGFDTSDSSHRVKHLFHDPESFVKRVHEILKAKKEVLEDEVLLADGTILERNFIPILKEGKYNGHLWTFKDVSLQRKYNKSLEAQKNKYSGIIANMNLGIIELDLSDKIVFVNQSYINMSGYSKDELLGSRIHKILAYSGANEIIENKKRQRLKGESISFELKIINKKKQIRYWLVSSAPNYNLKGEIIGAIAICLDITNLKSLEKQKTKILKELENRNNELEEYAHIVSHDLKSPLRSINALTSWIKSDNKDKFDDVTIQNFNLIEDTLEKMELLISDILTFSSAGIETKEKTDVDLHILVEELKKTIYIPKHIQINILNQLPIVYGDRTKYLQLFQNLLSNAIKFCDKEKGIIELNAIEKGEFYEFSVKDNGIGIEKKYQKKIFKMFHSLQESKDSTGIGLSIVKKIIDLYEGEIRVESEINRGATFIFTLKK